MPKTKASVVRRGRAAGRPVVAPRTAGEWERGWQRTWRKLGFVPYELLGSVAAAGSAGPPPPLRRAIETSVSLARGGRPPR